MDIRTGYKNRSQILFLNLYVRKVLCRFDVFVTLTYKDNYPSTALSQKIADKPFLTPFTQKINVLS